MQRPERRRPRRRAGRARNPRGRDQPDRGHRHPGIRGKGLAGARIDEIAGKATKRKIYYYFDGKEELYRAVLERAYRQVRDSEAQVDITSGTAPEALRRLIEHDVHYHARHPELVRLVMNENIHRAQHLKQIADLPDRNHSVIEILRRLLARGEAEGSFRPGSIRWTCIST
jgi:AcrR family transcriptional regulator